MSNLPILIIGISGKKRGGKNTTADILTECLGADKCSIAGFADALKHEVCDALGISLGYLEQHKEAHRDLLKAWGELRRNHSSRTYWIDKIDQMTHLAGNSGRRYFLIPDVRYQNEYDFIKSRGGLVLRVTRMFRGNVMDDCDSHISETALDNAKFDAEFIAETREQLAEKVTAFASTLPR